MFSVLQYEVKNWYEVAKCTSEWLTLPCKVPAKIRCVPRKRSAWRLNSCIVSASVIPVISSQPEPPPLLPCYQLLHTFYVWSTGLHIHLHRLVAISQLTQAPSKLWSQPLQRIHLAIHAKKTFSNLDKWISFRQIHFAIWTNTFCNLKYKAGYSM